MNAKALLAILLVVGGICLALTSRSTLTPKRGGDHVFYGAENQFISQEIAIGDFDGDDLDDIVTTGHWNNPDCGGWPTMEWYVPFVCNKNWTTFLAENTGDTIVLCEFPDSADAAEQWALWECEGWEKVPGSEGPCDTCTTAEKENEKQGAAYVFLGGDWSTKGHDIDLSTGSGADHVVLGRVAQGDIFNAMAAGDVDGDGVDELILGAPGIGAGNGAGEVYVIKMGDAAPDTIDLSDSAQFDSLVVHHFAGRDSLDGFGYGVAAGDLDNDSDDEVIVGAPFAADSTGEVYVFYANDSLPTTVDLSTSSDADIADYGQVIYGADAGDRLGVTHMETLDPEHGGGYDPVGLTVGAWNSDDAVEDLVLGAGHADADTGAAYVVFGGAFQTVTKLEPGNVIQLSYVPSSADSACDIRIDGSGDMRLGAGVGIVDADSATGGRDLLVGAPAATGDGKPERGNVYIIFSDTRTNLTSDRVRSVGSSSDFDVVILGEGEGAQLGGHFSGNLDFDNDGMNDVGIAGEGEMTVFFGQSQTAWGDTIDLTTVLQSNPEMRVIEFEHEPSAHSTTIRFADLDGDANHDLVFGGYDSPGYSGEHHAGQMWVTKGQDMWKNANVTENTTWSGNVFVNGDINVAPNATLTIAAGTDVWIWPKDPDSSDDNGPGYPAHIDSNRIEFRVHGYLDVNGTESDPVRFLAWTADSTVSTDKFTWRGIFVHDTTGTGAEFDYCEIRNALDGISANSDFTLKNSLIEYCDVGLNIAFADSVYVDGTTIRNSDFAGINLAADTRLLLKDSEVSQTINHGVKVYTGAKLYAVGSTFRENDVGINVFDAGSGAGEADIDSCTINSNDIGVKTYKASNVSVTSCTVDSNTTDGILCELGTNTIDGNDIRYNGVGVYTLNGAHATITDNTITDNSTGIKCDDDSDPPIEGNDLTSNVVGVSALNDADPDLGHNSGGSSDGENKIYACSSHFVVNLSTGITLMAEDNYWNNPTFPYGPKGSKISGSVDYDPALAGGGPSPVAPGPDVSRMPIAYDLQQNVPNPFNPTTTIRYQVPSPGGSVRMELYNVRGQLVKVLVTEESPPGFHAVVWDGTNEAGQNVSSGVYFLRMRAKAFVKTRKLVLLK